MFLNGGKMCQMLRTVRLDIVILTEGIVKDIVAGNPSKIVQVYVESPLIWYLRIHLKYEAHEKRTKTPTTFLSMVGEYP
jgi:hypothetical protein